MPETGFNWSEDRVRTLSRMWVEGASSGLISRTLGGVTRNAVMGKVNRLGLMGARGRAGSTPAMGSAERLAEAMPPLPARPLPAPARAPSVAGPGPAHPRSVRDLVAAALSGSHPASRGAASPRAAATETAPVRQPPREPEAPKASKPRPARPRSAKVPVPADAAAVALPAEAIPVVAVAIEPAAIQEPVREPVDEPAPEPVLSLFSWETPREDGRPTILGLRAESCRWPIGDPAKPGFHFCGEAASEPRPYCTEHCALAYQVRDPNRPKVTWSPMRIAQARQATLARLRQGPQRSRARA